MGERQIKRLEQFLEILRHKQDYWPQVEALREKWELPKGGFPKWPDDCNMYSPDIVPWHQQWENRGVDDPRERLFEEVCKLNREHGLPFPFDQTMYDYLLHGEYDSPSTLAVQMGYDEVGERYAVIHITPDTTQKDIRNNWDQVKVARQWLSKEWGVEITPPARCRPNLERDLFIWKRVRRDGRTYKAAYSEWLHPRWKQMEEPDDEGIDQPIQDDGLEPSAIIHAVRKLEEDYKL